MIGLAIIVSISLTQTPLFPQGVPVMTFGGQLSCAAAWDTANAPYSQIWLSGFWSGLNIAGGRAVGRSTDRQGIEGEVRKVCMEEPSLSLVSATLKTYRLLYNKGV